MNTDELLNEVDTLRGQGMTVVVLIGENGVGKSSFLARYAEHIAVVDHNINVMAISNTPHDKFNVNPTSAQRLGQRNGSRYAMDAIKDSLKRPRNEVATSLRRVGDVLQGLGYERTVGLAISGINIAEGLEESRLSEEVQSLVKKIRNTVKEELDDQSKVIWIDLDDNNESRTGASIVPRLLQNEATITAAGVCRPVRIVLRKCITLNGVKKIINFDLDAASSGEIGYLASMAWASAKIKENSVVLIDEPENSLHPRWQVQYIENLYHFFKYEKPFFVVATHSPVLLSGDQNYPFDVITYRLDPDGQVHQIDTADEGLEGISWSAFQVIPKNNQYVAGMLIDAVNAVCARKMTIEDAGQFMDEIEKACIDPEQRNVVKIYKQTLMGIINEK
ncbi:MULTISPECIES: ATP-binding protein [unclassified Janthinobacterium]|uniref:ATP-binding protein n=1 Tax=unclassified Janthinobacterium TaxID=2610881 RepID=UPI0027129991|nr:MULTISPECIES: ATP-binding protein [unclassified Janthinobacterium]MDO8064884.1 ATP-binding protein [Janthinobacterium sp. SUN206]MDO8071223.1 ATP-binding protein [Janthinobacterium sp. SUN176]